MVSGSISLPCSGYFSPFPHGTGSLSVSQEYLALPDGTGSFIQDFSGLALLRILARFNESFHVPGYHRLRLTFPGNSTKIIIALCKSYNPNNAVTLLVWANPRSLATTCGITIVFSSSGYLDVSVHRVCFPPYRWDIPLLHGMGCPIRKSPDRRSFAPPRSLSQLVTSFFASESQGIHHTPLFISLY
jgi:hypothetical protein